MGFVGERLLSHCAEGATKHKTVPSTNPTQNRAEYSLPQVGVYAPWAAVRFTLTALRKNQTVPNKLAHYKVL